MVILIHSSKTMKPTLAKGFGLSKPKFAKEASVIADYLRTLTSKQIQASMQVSTKLAGEIQKILKDWSDKATQGAAMFSFRGDVYSGLQVESFNDSDIKYANEHLRILSGLYGILRPLDGVCTYRLEMGYKLPNSKFNSLYRYWGARLAETIPTNQLVVNLTSEEYGKAILPFLDKSKVISPKFVSFDTKLGNYKTIAVHSKIARGAFAHWLIKNQLKDVDSLTEFNELGYKYVSSLSTELEPLHKCEQFGGKGLSVRLKS